MVKRRPKTSVVRLLGMRLCYRFRLF